MRVLQGAFTGGSETAGLQWIDGVGKTGGGGVGDENLGVKPGGDEPIGRRGTPELDVQELELKQQPAQYYRCSHTYMHIQQ